ncbi:ribosomal protein S18-alanine N-acetyltransferase [Microbacterium rhizomatis]|uniref:Ribosomal-protein-alanine N-acetyltransferase n=1 Tax=Microbacterium rhizomatis TaxID=1631477 RepID=A0A5J5J2Z9_9MICO|nr:ribosomal protein S18-alanine N-acetyltransferase [Microbacterium rhizomatis]KAA9107763.1 ribosomal-protein-alanine N-acetyltransferase [Microbacterium rhizomatis]
MSIRRATTADLGAIMTLERASFPTDAWSDAMMREELSSPHGWYVVDESAGTVVGYAGLRAPRGSSDADVQTIAIAEASRGRGRGRALLTALLAEAAERAVKQVFLEVRADNPVAEALYASEGFAEIGRRPHYYQPDDVDAIVMQLDVRVWVHARAGRTAETTLNDTGAERAEAPESPGASTPADGDRPKSDAGACT